MMRSGVYWAGLMAAATPVAAMAAPRDEVATLRADLASARAQIAAQQRSLDAQEQRLRALEARMIVSVAPTNPATGAGTPPAPALTAAQGSAVASTPGDPSTIQQAPLERVGQAAPGSDRPPEVAVLGSEGSVVTRKGQLTAEASVKYARADRNQAIFRGVALNQVINIGIFNISESRQDILTVGGALRYGLTDKLEVGVRVPFVHRSNNLLTTPIGQANQAEMATASKGTGLGDMEFSARYQLVAAHRGWPYLIGNLQVVAPTGSDPFGVRRRDTGEELESATGAGFWGVSPSVTAILPTDPAVLFGTIGYTHNFGRSFNVPIGSAILEYVKPGDALAFSAGIGISLNQRTSVNLGYAHSWAFGIRTVTRLLEPANPANNPSVSRRSRDLQVGRLLMGMTYKVNDRASMNWSVEIGATEDATDVRSVLRIPLILLSGG